MAFLHLVFGVLGATAAAAAGVPNGASATCAVTRILADGREIRSTAPDPGGATAKVRRGNRVAQASASSRGSSRSSVSVSSSSSSSSSSSRRGRSMARAVSSHTDEAGRTVTTTRDQQGCTIVIDESDLSGEE